MFFIFLFCSLLIGFTNADCSKKFPKNFKFGVSTAAYQIEGAWNEDGKGESIWDRICHTNPNFVKNGDNGDVTCDAYHKTKEDVQLLKNLGINHYRFSISWPRILPTGFTNKINKAGILYYKNLIRELRRNNIEPMVTLFHWDLPQPLQDIGGWMNPQMEYHFANYARLLFKNFGNDVKTWFTFNEPKNLCVFSYGIGRFPPLVKASGIGDYLCSHLILKSHARAYHIYDKEFRRKQKGRVSITLDFSWLEPFSKEDEEQAEISRQFSLGWYAHPLFFGDYPKIMKERIAYRSKMEGFPVSRLPKFTKEEIAYIKGTLDFFSYNTYTTNYIKKISEVEFGFPGLGKDTGGQESQNPTWVGSASVWLKVVPWGIRKSLKWISDTYNKPEIIITENGVSDTGDMDDQARISYHRDYLSNVLDALNEDGVNVSGYTAWSFMDDFEWINGFTEKFGLYHVDFNSPNRTRTPKKSVEFFKKVTSTHCLDNI